MSFVAIDATNDCHLYPVCHGYFSLLFPLISHTPSTYYKLKYICYMILFLDRKLHCHIQSSSCSINPRLTQ